MKSRRSIISIVFALEIIILVSSATTILLKLPNTNFQELNQVKTIDIINNSFKIPNKPINNYAIEKLKTSFYQYWNNCRYSDYYQPLSGNCLNSSGLSITLFEFLDALYLANLSHEFELASNFILEKISPERSKNINVYELSTKVIGSLLSIYGLTGENSFLSKSKMFADLVLHSFTGPMPHPFIDGTNQKPFDFGFMEGTFLSETSGFLLEFANLYDLTGDGKYFDKIQNYISCIANSSDKITYGIWSTENCEALQNTPSYNQLISSFFTNFIKFSQIYDSNYSEKITNNVYKAIYEFSNPNIYHITDRFAFIPESICEVISLTKGSIYEQKISHISNICARLRNNFIPSSYVDSDEFNFDTSLLYEDFNRSVSIDDLKNLECGNVLCSLSSIGHNYKEDLMPSSAISKWLKFLLLRDVEDLGYTYVINDAGHMLPLTHENIYSNIN